MYSLSGVRVSRAGRDILLLPELTVPTDAFTVILGHNGSGKSTLASLLSGLARPDAGSVRLDGDEVSAVPERARARRVAFLPQKLPASEGLTCRELVRLGRHPWRGLLGRWRPQDEAIIDASLRMTGTERFAADWADELSGGERQRVWIAMLLAQAAPVMILDEPTSALDVKHQYGVLALLERLREEKGVGVITIIHDVNLALRFATHVVALKGGRLLFEDGAQLLRSEENLERLFETPVRLVEHPDPLFRKSPVAVICA